MGAELDLIPVLSTIVHVIPVVLIAVRFVGLQEHTVDHAPIQASPAPSREKMEEQDKERVVVRIVPEGFIVSGADAAELSLPCQSPCAPADYDYVRLSETMLAAHQRHPSAHQVIVAPAPSVPYEVIIGVFDAATHRTVGTTTQALFSDPVLVDGASAPATGNP